jgi:hypothetical protein
MKAGDKNTEIRLLEGNKALMEGEIEIMDETKLYESEALEYSELPTMEEIVLTTFRKLGEPLGPYKDFDTCVASVKREKGLSDERARKYCGYLYWKIEKGRTKVGEAKVDVPPTGDYIHVRVEDPDKYDKDSFRTIDITEGIKARVGCPKGQFTGGKCQVGTQVQVYLFDKDKYTEDKAKKWVEEHKKEATVEVPKDKVLATSGEPQEAVHVKVDKQVPEVPSNPLNTGPMQEPKTPEQVEKEKKVMIGKAISPEPDLSKLIPAPKVEKKVESTTGNPTNPTNNPTTANPTITPAPTTAVEPKLEDKVKELQEALNKLQNTLKETEKSIDKKLQDAIEKTKLEEQKKLKEQLKKKYISGVYSKNKLVEVE